MDTVYESIHFRAEVVDFGMPPNRFGTYWSKANPWRPGTDWARDWGAAEEREAADKKQKARGTRMALQASKAERAKRYATALAIYRTMSARDLGDTEIVRDRIDLLSRVRSRDVKGLQAYLRATVDQTSRLPNPGASAMVLRPFIGYWQIRALAGTVKREDVARRYRQMAADYPTSPKAPACLIMSARTLLEQRSDKSPAPNPGPAKEALDTLLAKYPDSRFRTSALGWRVRIDYVEGRYAQAIGRYRELLASAKTLSDKRIYLDSILLCQMQLGSKPGMTEAYLLRLGILQGENDLAISRLWDLFHLMTAEQAQGFRVRLRGNPELALYYMQYRSDITEPTRELVKIARSLGDRFRKEAASGPILALGAKAALGLGQLPEARELATLALSRRGYANDRALATFVLASVDQRRGRKRQAERGFKRLVADYPNSYLVGGAKENLAILYERSNRMNRALEIYFDLDYDDDVTYMLEMRMTPRQIQSFLASHPNHPKRSLIAYSLGFRHMRIGNWRSARSAFRQVSRTELKKLNRFSYEYDNPESHERLYDPLKTVAKLASLDGKIRRARGSEAKAKAMMAMADYYYVHRDLLMYNPALWDGARQMAVAYSWNSRFANADDDRALKQHHYEHECLVHALRLCKEIVRRYPHTKVAGRASYRGACAAHRLGNMATFWRWENRNVDFLSQARSLMLFCSKTKDPDLAKAAKKYSAVYLGEHKELVKEWLSEYSTPKGRYQNYSLIPGKED